VKPKLSLADRIFTCDACGLVIDRDRGAALNLKGVRRPAVAGRRETRVWSRPEDRARPGRWRETPTPHYPGGQDGDRRPATVGCEQ
jgi:putative transposase